MCQQTRVAAVIPYYQRFLSRFPDVAALARASEPEVLALWSGLGYYSRARNLMQAAKTIIESGGFPRDYASLRELPGIGDYTAAAIASIAFGLPHAVVDGNVRRVIARLTNRAEADVPHEAAQLMDRKDPARSNQALMELGAMVCLPRNPLCGECPIQKFCGAHRHGTVEQLPPPCVKPATVQREHTLLIVRRGARVLLMPSQRVQGFWDLPERESFAPATAIRLGANLGTFRHSITNSRYVFEVREAIVRVVPKTARWCEEDKLGQIALSTTAKKALRILTSQTPR
jgi:A/G-specific adenine glycosylase